MVDFVGEPTEFVVDDPMSPLSGLDDRDYLDSRCPEDRTVPRWRAPGESPPEDPEIGDLYLNTTTGMPMEFNGTAWNEVQGEVPLMTDPSHYAVDTNHGEVTIANGVIPPGDMILSAGEPGRNGESGGNIVFREPQADGTTREITLTELLDKIDRLDDMFKELLLFRSESLGELDEKTYLEVKQEARRRFKGS